MNRVQPLFLGDHALPYVERAVSGGLVSRQGVDFYRIVNVDRMPAFFMSVVSHDDHWLYVASNGGLTAGRKNPKLALFPYLTEDKIIDSAGITGPHTSLIVTSAGKSWLWRPFSELGQLVYDARRSLEKSVLGDRLAFEELNEQLELCFGYEWKTSSRYGFVRECWLENRGTVPLRLRVLDGLLNLLPADVDEQLQAGYSCLLDAYKVNECMDDSRLAVFTLASQVTDRAEPRESLHATSVFSLGLPGATLQLCADRIQNFELGQSLTQRATVRGRRGAYLLGGELSLEPGERSRWLIVADVDRSQRDVSELARRLLSPEVVEAEILADVAEGSEALRRIVAATDGLELSADCLASAHHLANVLFNDMRGGVYAFDHAIPVEDFRGFLRTRSRGSWQRHGEFLGSLPAFIERSALMTELAAQDDPNLERLGYEYLPITFSRRHGDPSRPWNRFEIRLRNADGARSLSYQGNWRDIFQNWEALSLSFPEFVESIIVKFLNASTADGYNPYRVTNEGIDWEVPEPNHPWASIGYWGDHQIIYSLKLLELSHSRHPGRLEALLFREIFAYANVPYRIAPYAELLRNPRDTIRFDAELNSDIEGLVRHCGSDGKLLLSDGDVYRVNLVEKLLVTLLAKLSNFVPGGGIWLNTLRPEWNDANNALVGNGLSMVTLCYLERFLGFARELLRPLAGQRVTLSTEVRHWLEAIFEGLQAHTELLGAAEIGDEPRKSLMDALGGAGSAYREQLYAHGFSSRSQISGERVLDLLGLAARFVRHTIEGARRPDGLYHSYNLLVRRGRGMGVTHLYEMLEGQVAALSSPELGAGEACRVLEALRASRMYRADQNSYTLYPDRELASFLGKNVVSDGAVAASPLLKSMLEASDERIVHRDAQGRLRFHPDFCNASACRAALESLRESAAYAQIDDAEIERVLQIYESVFEHHAFTGRSGTMFAYEGLGSIYWHMVGKLVLAVQEQYLWAVERGEREELCTRLVAFYHELREGLGGVAKSPAVYGAFPLDPYSHTPAGSGARQPGMTGQVKEELLSRQAELGVRVRDGRISFRPLLLRRSEFLEHPARFEALACGGAPLEIELPAGSLAFTCCQVPIIYHLGEERRIVVSGDAFGTREIQGDSLGTELSAAIFGRTGAVTRVDVWVRLGC